MSEKEFDEEFARITGCTDDADFHDKGITAALRGGVKQNGPVARRALPGRLLNKWLLPLGEKR
jgi:hypothetical protein